MKIPASRLRDYIDPDIDVRICLKSGIAWRTLSHDPAKALISRSAISGVGSASRLKYCVLEVAPLEAEAILDQHYQDIRVSNGTRGRLQHSQASQTCVRETSIGLPMCFKHVRTDAFSPEAIAQVI